jgi:2-dehydro-3-deoxy-L-rhamnonate dehydrogenase (NAD+)
MLKRSYGRILHVVSIAGKEGNAGMAAYTATKAGLIGLVKSLAKNCSETGVTTSALAPAVIRTPLVEVLPDATVRYMTDKIPMRQCGELAEVSAMIAWIISPVWDCERDWPLTCTPCRTSMNATSLSRHR